MYKLQYITIIALLMAFISIISCEAPPAEDDIPRPTITKVYGNMGGTVRITFSEPIELTAAAKAGITSPKPDTFAVGAVTAANALNPVSIQTALTTDAFETTNAWVDGADVFITLDTTGAASGSAVNTVGNVRLVTVDSNLVKGLTTGNINVITTAGQIAAYVANSAVVSAKPQLVKAVIKDSTTILLYFDEAITASWATGKIAVKTAATSAGAATGATKATSAGVLAVAGDLPSDLAGSVGYVLKVTVATLTSGEYAAITFPAAGIVADKEGTPQANDAMGTPVVVMIP